MTLALQLGATILWWAMLFVAAVLIGAALIWLAATVYDWRCDRDACKRAERLIDPRVRTLIDDLDRIWGLDCARDRDLRWERTGLVADLYALERCPVQKVRL